MIRSVLTPTFADRLHQAADHVRIPTLLVRGLKSDLVSEQGVAELRMHLPQLEVFDVVGAGHMVAGDKTMHSTMACSRSCASICRPPEERPGNCRHALGNCLGQ